MSPSSKASNLKYSTKEKKKPNYIKLDYNSQPEQIEIADYNANPNKKAQERERKRKIKK